MSELAIIGGTGLDKIPNLEILRREGPHDISARDAEQVSRTAADACVDVAAYQRKRDVLCDGLLRAGYEVRKPEGGYYVFLRSAQKPSIQNFRLTGVEVINPWRLGEATKDLCRFNYLWFFLLRPQFIKVDHNLLLLT